MPVSNRRPPRWTGWYRYPRGPWIPLVTCGTEREAWDALLDRAKAVGFAGGLAVLPESKRPDSVS
jgi:hypothetical protein